MPLNLYTSSLSTHKILPLHIADKMCDQISDAVLDAHLRQDPDCKVRFFKSCMYFYSIAIDYVFVGCMRDSDQDGDDHDRRGDHIQGQGRLSERHQGDGQAHRLRR